MVFPPWKVAVLEVPWMRLPMPHDASLTVDELPATNVFGVCTSWMATVQPVKTVFWTTTDEEMLGSSDVEMATLRPENEESVIRTAPTPPPPCLSSA